MTRSRPPTAAADTAASYVALLRGINVGTAKRIAMAELRTLLTDLGLGKVRTLLQSGNAIFTSDGDADEIAARIETGLRQAFDLTARCLVRPGADISRVLTSNPWPHTASQGSKLLVLFLSGELGPDLAPEQDPAHLDPGRVFVSPGVVYQWCPDGILAAPPVSAFIEKHWPVWVTGRNLNTVARMDALLRVSTPS